nr:hypothetical protein [Streptococcus dysgalactiae]
MRGLVMRYILPKYPYVAIIVSAWLFAGMHYTTSWIHSFYIWQVALFLLIPTTKPIV